MIESNINTINIEKTSTAPVSLKARIKTVDLLRGCAILGILVINIMAFSMTEKAMEIPSAGGGHTGVNLVVWSVGHLVFFQKFLSLFSMLFGAGMILMWRRIESSGRNFTPIYYRRLGWLLLFGILHAYFLWWGDILFYYAVCGLALYPLRKLSAPTLIVGGFVIYMVTALFYIGVGLGIGYVKGEADSAALAIKEGREVSPDQKGMASLWDQISKEISPTPEKIEEEAEIFRSGYWDIFFSRLPIVLVMQTIVFVIYIVWHILGMMLIGMGLFKSGFLTGLKSRRFYLVSMLLGYTIGFSLSGIYIDQYISSGFALDIFFGELAVTNRIATLATLTGHISLIMLFYKADIFGWLRESLIAVGRMALTSYLTHTIVFIFIFYGFGLGLFGRFDRLEQIWFVFGMWAFQLVVSRLWMKRFRFGPAEWLWRTLTYGKKQPMRI